MRGQANSHPQEPKCPAWGVCREPGLCGRAALTGPRPAVNPSSVMSPAGSSQAEEQQYLDKLKQLSKYIEPLRRMINKIDKNEGEGGACRGLGQDLQIPRLCLSAPASVPDRKKDLSKMKSLLDILTDPSKR